MSGESFTLDVNGITLKIAVVHTLGAADRLLDALRKGEVEYHFVEVMSLSWRLR